MRRGKGSCRSAKCQGRFERLRCPGLIHSVVLPCSCCPSCQEEGSLRDDQHPLLACLCTLVGHASAASGHGIAAADAADVALAQRLQAHHWQREAHAAGAEAAACDASAALLDDASGAGRRAGGVSAAAAAAVRAQARARRGAAAEAGAEAEGAEKLAAEMQRRADDHASLATVKHLLAAVALGRLQQVRSGIQ